MMTAETQRELGAYFSQCQSTDWFYMMADFGEAYTRGKRMFQRAVERADTSEKREILAAFQSATASRMPHRQESEHLPWPIAEDFNLVEADLEA